MRNEEALGKEKMWKLIAGMAIPGIMAQIVNLLYNVVDRHILCGMCCRYDVRHDLRNDILLQIQKSAVRITVIHCH